MKKTVSLLLAVLMLLAGLAGCQKPAEKAKVRLMMIKGPTGIGAVQLMKENDGAKTENTYQISIAESPEDVVAKIANGEADIAAVPTNLAASLYKKTNGGVQLLAVNTLGVLYLMENGESIREMADLRGKTVYSTGQGANPEYILNYLLQKNGLTPGVDVTIKFLSQNEELATALALGEAEIALVPEPTVTTVQSKNTDLRIALNITEEWEKADSESRLLMGCVVARKAFVQENPEATEAFLKEYKASIEAALEDVEETAGFCEQYGIIPKAAVAQKAIPNCNLIYLDGSEMKDSIAGYYQVLFDANPKSIGGALPDDDFYYEGTQK